jgi:hypothetical protein
MQELGAGTSYLTHRPLELTFGLGRATRATRVEVRWPDGREQAFDDLAADRILELSPGRPPREVERAPR